MLVLVLYSFVIYKIQLWCLLINRHYGLIGVCIALFPLPRILFLLPSLHSLIASKPSTPHSLPFYPITVLLFHLYPLSIPSPALYAPILFVLSLLYSLLSPPPSVPPAYSSIPSITYSTYTTTITAYTPLTTLSSIPPSSSSSSPTPHQSSPPPSTSSLPRPKAQLVVMTRDRHPPYAPVHIASSPLFLFLSLLPLLICDPRVYIFFFLLFHFSPFTISSVSRCFSSPLHTPCGISRITAYSLCLSRPF